MYVLKNNLLITKHTFSSFHILKNHQEHDHLKNNYYGYNLWENIQIWGVFSFDSSQYWLKTKYLRFMFP